MDVGTNTGVATDVGTNTGVATDVGTNTGVATDVGTNTGVATDVGTNTGVATDVGTNTGVATDVGTNTGVASGVTQDRTHVWAYLSLILPCQSCHHVPFGWLVTGSPCTSNMKDLVSVAVPSVMVLEAVQLYSPESESCRSHRFNTDTVK